MACTTDNEAIAAEAAPTKVWLQLGDKQISPMSYLGKVKIKSKNSKGSE